MMKTFIMLAIGTFDESRPKGAAVQMQCQIELIMQNHPDCGLNTKMFALRNNKKETNRFDI